MWYTNFINIKILKYYAEAFPFTFCVSCELFFPLTESNTESYDTKKASLFF